MVLALQVEVMGAVNIEVVVVVALVVAFTYCLLVNWSSLSIFRKFQLNDQIHS